MTNYEWLLQMGGEERQAWFDAEHVDANDALSAVNDVSADAADANDANVAQDSREKLEADIWAGCEHLTTAKRHALVNVHWRDLLGWLDRQAAIMRLECAEEYRTRLSELHGLLDKAASERELLRAELTEYKHSHQDAPNQLISQYDELKSEEPAGICTAKCDMHDFADSREKLEADVRKHYAYSTTTLLYPPSANKTTDMLRSLPIDTVVGWLDRQAAITAEETSGAWEEYRDATQREIAELTAQVDELQTRLEAQINETACQSADYVAEQRLAIELQAQVDELQAERDNLARDLAECDESRIELMERCERAEKALVEMERERDYWELHTDCWADKCKDMRTSRDCFKERAKRNEDKAKNYQRQLSKAERYGTIWPRWKDGAPIELPCAFEYMGNTERLQGIRFYSNAYVLEFTGIDHAKESFGIEYGTRHSRPPLVASDGKPILKGETLYGLSDSKAWTVTGFDRTRPWSVWAENGGGCKCLKPEWLAHEKPADGARAEKIAALEAENAELREKLGEAIGHAHEIGKLGDLEGRAAS